MNRMLRRASLYGIGLGLILVSAAVGIVFIALSVHAWLTPLVGAAWAGLILGASLVTPAAGYGGWAYLRHRQHQREEAERAALALEQGGQSSVTPILGAVIGLIGALFRAKPVTATALAATAGVIASRNPRLVAAAARRLLPHL